MEDKIDVEAPRRGQRGGCVAKIIGYEAGVCLATTDGGTEGGVVDLAEASRVAVASPAASCQ